MASTHRNSSTLTGGSGIADFLLGDAASASLSNFAYLQFRTPWTHFFVQDDWKVSRHLTLNIGLRYELSPPPVEKNNKIANFDIDGDPGESAARCWPVHREAVTTTGRCRLPTTFSSPRVSGSPTACRTTRPCCGEATGSSIRTSSCRAACNPWKSIRPSTCASICPRTPTLLRWF